MKRIRRRGFTLVELLVVVAIISVLAAMLLPVLSKARVAAQSTACTSKLKQLGVYHNMYTDDFGGIVAPALRYGSTAHTGYDSWNMLFSKSRNATWGVAYGWDDICRSWQNASTPFRLEMTTCPGRQNHDHYSDYGRNGQDGSRQCRGHALGGCGYNGKRFALFRRPSQQACLGDASSVAVLHGTPTLHRVGFYHNGRTNLIYWDLHAGSLTKGDVPIANYKLFWDGN